MRKKPARLELHHPVTFIRDGFPVVVDTLVVRRPTKDEARQLSDKVGLDQTFAMIALLSSVPVSAIEDLRARDFFRLCEVMTSEEP